MGVATCTAAGVAGIVILAAPSLLTLPIVSVVGFGAGGVQAGKHTQENHSAHSLLF